MTIWKPRPRADAAVGCASRSEWDPGWLVYELLLFAKSGGFLRFNNAFLVTGDPRIENPTRDRWFDTSVFSALPAFTPRTNPKQYDGLTGPKFWNIDFTLTKVFPIDERYQLELRVESFNLTNSFIPTDPVINALGPDFGKCINQLNRGREISPQKHGVANAAVRPQPKRKSTAETEAAEARRV